MSNNPLYNMYVGDKEKRQAAAVLNDKNPNRVAGGLRAQGVDHYTMLGEDGTDQKVPTHRYVQSLEEQLRKHKEVMTVMERKLNRLTREQGEMSNYLSTLKARDK